MVARLPGVDLLEGGLRRLHPLEPLWLSGVLACRRPRAYLSPGFNPPRWSPVPFAFTIHDLIHVRFPAEATPVRRAYYELVVRPAAHRARCVLTVSEHSRGDILEWSGLPEDRVVVVGCGIGDAFGPAGPARSLGRPHLLCVSNAFPHKNLPRLIAAFARARLDRDLLLVLVTAPDQALRRAAAELDVADRVLFTGRIADAELAALYRGAVAAVCPSLFEGFGLPALEAMACGTPVVCSDRTSIPEVVGGAGLYVDPGDEESIAGGLERIAGDGALRARLSRDGLARAGLFSWDGVACARRRRARRAGRLAPSRRARPRRRRSVLMRVAIVAQRYGQEVVGGAESHARTLAGRLRADLGWQVEVFTTTAVDHRSWANHYAPGRTLVDGIPVWRFDSSARRRRLLFAAYRRLAEPAARARPSPLLESLWLRLQGPYSPRLLDGIRRHAARFDRFLFFSYLYHPTVRGVGLVGSRAVLIPTAHDEAPLHFATTRRLFERCPLILANTEPERDLIRRVAPAARVEVAGVGFDDDGADAAADERLDDAGGAPYLLYLGRVSRGKGVAALIEWFLRARARLGRPLVLRLAGRLERDIALPATPAVEYLGHVSEGRKRQLMRGALAVVNPSPHESMSMLVLEGIAAGVPVLVNRACPVLDHYTRQVETCVGYDGEAEFTGALARLVARDWRAPEARARLDDGRRWVRERFSWRRVLDVFARSLTPKLASVDPQRAQGSGLRAFRAQPIYFDGGPRRLRRHPVRPKVRLVGSTQANLGSRRRRVRSPGRSDRRSGPR